MQQSFTFPQPEAEEWRPITGFEGFYEVSDLGRVRSLDRIVAFANRWGGISQKPIRGMILKQARRSGYPSVTLTRDGDALSYLVHGLVLTAFAGPRPVGQVARHGPSGKLDNRLTNLCWGTHSENNGPDKVRDGTAWPHRGEKAARSVLTTAIVIECRRRFAGGESQTSLAREHGVGLTAMHSAISGRSWAWLPGALPATPGRCRRPRAA